MSTDQSIRRSSRDRALKALVHSYEGEAICHDLLEEWQRVDPLSSADAALAAELTIGVSRHRLTCEHIAARFYRRRWLGLPVPVRVILALGVYQLCWLDRIPDHAVVDQAVRQAKRYGRGAGAAANAILRKVIECRGDVVEPPDDPDPRSYLPLDRDRGRLFGQNVFPDPTRRPLDYLIAVTSHPPWLIERWHRRFKPKLCRQICDAGLRRPPLVLRPNSIRTTAIELRDRLLSEGHQATLTGEDASVALAGDPSVSSLAAFKEGLCQPQDTTAQAALRLSPPQPGNVVIDLCAGVGTKSTQAAEMMNDSGIVIATDTNTDKLALISANAERLGLTITRPTSIEKLSDCIADLRSPPDLILVDAPCSNTGVLARRPEARYRAGQKSLQGLIEIQREILRCAQELASSTTRIIYSTCSLEMEENEEQVKWFCEAFPRWQVQHQKFVLPNEECDGGFAALLTGPS